jgi:23S rRNA pseudouridine2457 synthase
MNKYKYYRIYKPFEMLSQFKKDGKRPVLGELFQFDKDIYPLGRLDSDSEGLLLLTNEGSLNHKLLRPENRHKRTYLAQVEGHFSEEARAELMKGVVISIEGKEYKTLPAECEIISGEPLLPPRNPPIRYRKYIPVTWIRLTLHEGKNRQVRRMTAKVGFPTLRLVRESVQGINVYGLQPGEVQEISREEFYAKLNLNL